MGMLVSTMVVTENFRSAVELHVSVTVMNRIRDVWLMDSVPTDQCSPLLCSAKMLLSKCAPKAARKIWIALSDAPYNMGEREMAR